MSDLRQTIENKAEGSKAKSKNAVKKPLNTDWPKFQGKISIPDKVFNNTLIKPGLYSEQDRINDNEGLADNHFNQNPNIYSKPSVDRIENISRSIPPPQIKPSPAPQIEERKYSTQSINVYSKPPKEAEAKNYRPPPGSINASSSNFEKLLYSITRQKQIILDSTQSSIESLIINAIEQVKILCDVNSRCFNEIQLQNGSIDEACADLHSLLDYTRNFFAKPINRDYIENMRKPNFEEQYMDSFNSASLNQERLMPREGKLNKWIECSSVSKFLASASSLSILTNGSNIILFSPESNEKRTLNCIQDLKGTAILWSDKSRLIVTGGIARLSIEIDIRNGSIKNLPKPKPVRLHCMAFINNVPAIIGGLIKGPLDKVYTLEGSKWVNSSFLNYPRSHATCINVEELVYVFGGVSEGALLQSIEMWDGKWNLLGIHLPESRSNMGICMVKNEILLFGGNCGRGLKTSFNVWSFDCQHSIISILDDLNISFSSKTGYECALVNSEVHLAVSEDVNFMYKLPEKIGELSSVGSKEDSYESSFEDKDILDRMKFNE